MNEKISRKEALKRIAMIGGAVAGAAIISSCIPSVHYSKYCNGYCEDDMSTSAGYCNYSNNTIYCDAYNSYYSYLSYGYSYSTRGTFCSYYYC